MAVQQTHYRRLSRTASPSDNLGPAMLVHVAGKPTDVSFIDFNLAGHLFEEIAILHGEPDSLLHEPAGFGVTPSERITS